ncbi:uncharacterized protein LOC110758117 isoform X2 [Prunus avium]|uniref:Uncharacterized protein LOC110758117 isoform X2 n=1 Tax=Prunus avium TaxID=42229 RepID=A0A6P5SHW4_PRUAV|nr:uncharacterized protein LOC110758117 isoform X2 [Prunus avium]
MRSLSSPQVSSPPRSPLRSPLMPRSHRLGDAVDAIISFASVITCRHLPLNGSLSSSISRWYSLVGALCLVICFSSSSPKLLMSTLSRIWLLSAVGYRGEASCSKGGLQDRYSKVLSFLLIHKIMIIL